MKINAIDMKKIVKACYIASLDPNEFQGGFDQMIDYGGHNLSNGQKPNSQIIPMQKVTLSYKS